jgi:cell wall-associated NlpC family hydrolase
MVRRLVVVLLAMIVAAGLLAAPAAASAPTTLHTPVNRTVTAGRPTVIHSRLLTTADQPVAGRAVRLEIRYPGGSWRRHSTTTSNPNGVVAVRVTLGRTHYVRLQFAGDETHAASTSGRATVTVRPAGSPVVREAARHKGKPYGYGASGPHRFDCSGYTSYVYRKFGRPLPHSSRGQRSKTRRIAKSARRPGDLVFFHGAGGGVYHVGIYAGGNYMWDSPRAGKRVNRRPIFSARVSYGRVG